MTSVPTVSRHVVPPANENFTRGNPHWSRLLQVIGSKPELDSLTATRYGGCDVSVTLDESTSLTRDLSSWKWTLRDDNFGNVMEHFYDSTCMTILILS